MRTRTLLILAVVCGLAILLAGGIQLLRLSDSDPTANDLPIGTTATAGDAVVTVIGAEEDDGTMVVHVEVGGVDDPGGIDGLALLAGDELAPVADAPNACRGITVAAVACDLVFDTSEAKVSGRVLRLRRGGEQRRWELA